jgi:hypothetical protein
MDDKEYQTPISKVVITPFDLEGDAVKDLDRLHLESLQQAKESFEKKGRFNTPESSEIA